jgi:uncharacterized protein (TIGR02145 family)/uncharacterized repeat protein (TIGR02543 family)
MAVLAATMAVYMSGCGDNGTNSGTTPATNTNPGTGPGTNPGDGGGATGYTLTTYATPADGGTITRNPNAAGYNAGTQVTVTATPAAGYTFSGWSGTGTSSPNQSLTVTIYSNLTLYAVFQKQFDTFTLSTIVNPTGGGTITRSPNAASYDAGTQVTVTATPADGYSFANWSGASYAPTPTVTVTMNSGVAANGNMTLTANFSKAAVLPSAGTLTDSRNGKKYRIVNIGGKDWMAENLDYQTSSGSWCYENSSDGCNNYGRLYDWATAMGLDTSYNHNNWNGSDVKRRGICPSGWHLPSRREWGDLAIAAGGTGTYGNSDTAGKALKSTTGWSFCSGTGSGTDAYGFSALPGGRRTTDGSFYEAGGYGYWWTATEYYDLNAYRRIMNCSDGNVGEFYSFKEHGYSVRCVGD